MNKLTPKETYIQPPGSQLGQQTNAGWWADIADSPKCREAMQVALAELVMRERAVDSTDAAKAFYRIEGAKQFISILLNLGEPELPPKQPAAKQLIKS